MKKRTQEEYQAAIGLRFDRLQVIGTEKTAAGQVMICRCDCGKEIRATIYNLEQGRIKSCGCLRQERRHGETGTRLWMIWQGMHNRCEEPKNNSWKYYGGAGIYVCDEWFDYKTFRDWALSHGYKEGFSLDRKNGADHYGPDVCRWVDPDFQRRNKRNVIKIIEGPEVLTLTELAERHGLNPGTVKNRYRAGKRGADLVKLPEPRKKSKK